ncbi:MAG: hypothetical protein AVDCRST_MAG13-1408, partial [uncultured Solirubrobacteraceae bacterium]
ATRSARHAAAALRSRGAALPADPAGVRSGRSGHREVRRAHLPRHPVGGAPARARGRGLALLLARRACGDLARPGGDGRRGGLPPARALAARARRRVRCLLRQHAAQARLPPQAPAARGPARAHQDPDGPELPERARIVLLRRGAGVLRPPARGAPVHRSERDGVLARLPRRALPHRHPRGHGDRDRRGEPRPM